MTLHPPGKLECCLTGLTWVSVHYEARVFGPDAAPGGSAWNERKLLLCSDPCDTALKMAAFRPRPRCGLDFIGAALKDHKFSELERDCVCVCVCVCVCATEALEYLVKASARGPQGSTWRSQHSTAIHLGARPRAPADAHAGQGQQHWGPWRATEGRHLAQAHVDRWIWPRRVWWHLGLVEGRLRVGNKGTGSDCIFPEWEEVIFFFFFKQQRPEKALFRGKSPFLSAKQEIHLRVTTL